MFRMFVTEKKPTPHHLPFLWSPRGVGLTFAAGSSASPSWLRVLGCSWAPWGGMQEPAVSCRVWMSRGADELMFAALSGCSLPQVWSLEQPDWHCKIDEGSAGLVASCWSPDGRHILNTTEFHVSVQAGLLPSVSDVAVCLLTSQNNPKPLKLQRWWRARMQLCISM